MGAVTISDDARLHLPLNEILPNSFELNRWCAQHNDAPSMIFLRRSTEVGSTMCRRTFGRASVRINSQSEFSRYGNKCMRIRRNLVQKSGATNGLHFFRILNLDSTMSISIIGSSVMNSTRSRLTLANRRMSLNISVQYGLTDLPSTRDKSPPGKHYVHFQ